jgi:hypothetical protein
MVTATASQGVRVTETATEKQRALANQRVQATAT